MSDAALKAALPLSVGILFFVWAWIGHDAGNAGITTWFLGVCSGVCFNMALEDWQDTAGRR